MNGIVKKHQVLIEGTPLAAAQPGARPAPRCKKSVRLLRVENAVRALEVTCSCGETTVVEIQYPEAKT